MLSTTPWDRAPFMLTPYVLLLSCALALRLSGLEPVRGVVAALALYVAAAATVYWAAYGPRGVGRFYARLWGAPDRPLPLWLALDVALHFLPALMLGLPARPRDYAGGVAVLLAWYVAVARPRMQALYDLPAAVTDPWVLVGAPCLATVGAALLSWR